MACQASATADCTNQTKVATLANPLMAKLMGKSLRLRRDWDDVKLKVMEDHFRRKRAQGFELASKLLATGDAHVEEANRWGDRFWGPSDARELTVSGGC